MKYIKIFLASSIVELEAERLKLSDFIRALNDNYVRRGFYFELIICENISNAVNSERKQAEYNHAICDSQYFYIIFGNDTGKYTLEEFNVALNHFRMTGSPKIYTYFRKLSDGTEPSETIVSFMKRLDQEIGHYYSMFSHIDAVKLNILLELTRDTQIGDSVELEDGQALLNGNAVLSMNSIPAYQKNETVQDLLTRKKKLDDDYANMIQLAATCPDNPLITQMLNNNAQERNRVSEQLHTLERELLHFYSNITEKRQLGRQINWREKKAIELIDMGDYEGAKNILRDAQWSVELMQAEEILDSSLVRVREYISGKYTLIQTIKSTGITPEAEQEILHWFEKITALAEKHHIEMWVLYEYADFLMHHNNHCKAIEISEHLDHYYAFIRNSSEDCANNKYLLACMMYKTNNMQRAETLHRETLAIRERLCESQDPKYLAQYASSCNQLGYLLFRGGKLEEARQLYLNSVEILKKLQCAGNAYTSTLALTLNNLGNLAQRQKDYRQAEHFHLESMELRRTAAVSDSTSSLGFLAMSCLNYAKLLTEMGQTPKADSYYREAVELYDRLQHRDTKFRVDHAIAQYSRAAAMENTAPKDALKLHRQVLEQRLTLAKSNTAALQSDLADSYFSIGKLLYQLSVPEADEYLNKAYDLRLALYQQAPEKYTDAYQQICSYLNK